MKWHRKIATGWSLSQAGFGIQKQKPSTTPDDDSSKVGQRESWATGWSLSQAGFGIQKQKLSTTLDDDPPKISKHDPWVTDFTALIVAQWYIFWCKSFFYGAIIIFGFLGFFELSLHNILALPYDIPDTYLLFFGTALALWVLCNSFEKMRYYFLIISTMMILFINIFLNLVIISITYYEKNDFPLTFLMLFFYWLFIGNFLLIGTIQSFRAFIRINSSDRARELQRSLFELEKKRIQYRLLLKRKSRKFFKFNEVNSYFALYYYFVVRIILAMICFLFLVLLINFFEPSFWLASTPNEVAQEIRNSMYDAFALFFGYNLRPVYAMPVYYIGVKFTAYMLIAVIIILLSVSSYREILYRSGDFQKLLSIDSRPPVLILRAFGDDLLRLRARVNARRFFTECFQLIGTSFVRLIGEQIQMVGPVVTVAEPGGKLPPLGATRVNYEDQEWQAGVIQLINDSRLNLLIVGDSVHLTWEFNQICERGFLAKTILLFPPSSNWKLQRRWKSFLESVENETIRTRLARIDPKSTLVISFNDTGIPHPIVALRRNHWAYEIAIDHIIDLKGLVSNEGMPEMPTWQLVRRRIFSSVLTGTAIAILFGTHWIGQNVQLMQTDWWQKHALRYKALRAGAIVDSVSYVGQFSHIVRENPYLVDRLELKVFSDITHNGAYGPFPEFDREIRKSMAEAFSKIAQRASDQSIVDYINAEVKLLDSIAKQNPQECLEFTQSITLLAGYKQEGRAFEEAFERAYAQAQTLPPKHNLLIEDLSHLLDVIRSGPEPLSNFEMELIENGWVGQTSATQFCYAQAKFGRNWAALPPSDMVKIFRYMHEYSF